MIDNNGYPYASACSTTTVTLKIATDATSIEWFKEIDGEQILVGEGKEITFNPTVTAWYSCICDGVQSKVVKVSRLREHEVLNPNLPDYWYITNEIMAYTLVSIGGIYHAVDILGTYKKDETTYWMSTTYKSVCGWELVSMEEASPGAQNFYPYIDAKVEDIRLYFDDHGQHALYFEVYPGNEKSFSIGSDVMLGSAKVTQFSDFASLKAIFNGKSLQQVQMVGAANIQEAQLSDPALVLRLETPPDSYWIGFYSARRHFSYNKGTSTGLIHEDPNDRSIVSECQSIDSGMTVSWTNLSPIKPIKFYFGVGTVEEAGAVINNFVSIWTNLDPEDHSGGTVDISEDLCTLTAVSSPYCTFSEWRTNGGTIITPRMYAYLHITSIEGNVLTIKPDSGGIDVVAHFIRNFTVTYLREGKFPQVNVFNIDGEVGLDDNKDHNGYLKDSEYILLSPLKTANNFYFKQWELQNPIDETELLYEAGTSFILRQNTIFKPIWLPFPRVIFTLGDIVLDPAVLGELPEEMPLAPETKFVLPEAINFLRYGHSLKGWTTPEFKTCYPVGDTMQIHEEDIILIPVWKKDPFVEMLPEDKKAFMDGLRALYINMIKYYTFQDRQTNFIVQNIWGIVHRLQYYKEKYGTSNLLKREDITLCYNKAKTHVSIKERFPEDKIRLSWMPDWGLENILDCDWMKVFLRRYAKTVEAKLFARIFHDMDECGHCWN